MPTTPATNTKTTPPPDVDGEGERAMKLVKKLRKLIGEEDLPDVWLGWVYDSLAAGKSKPAE